MSKKGFNSDLDSVFAPGAQYEPNIDNSPWLLNTVADAKSILAERPPSVTRRARKSFDLDSLFASASEDRPREQRASDDLNVRHRDRPRRSLAILGGIDSLIRDTTGGVAIAKEDARQLEAAQVSVPKRVTFTYDRDRFARLKQLAREDGSYLKDIISGLLNDYVDGHAKQRRR